VLVAKSLRWIGIEVVGARPTGSAGDQDTLTVPCVWWARDVRADPKTM